MSRLFAPSTSPRVLAAPPSAPFLDVLAERLVADVPNPDDPFALADAIVLLPNRRAVRGLIDAFAARQPGVALLPSIKPLGDLDDDPDVWGPSALDLGIAPAIDPLRRRLELAALVRARDAAAGGVQDPVRAIAAANELAKLLDAAAASDSIDWSRLAALVEERDLAEHWRKSVDFLQIIAQFWPAHLAENGLSDPGERRNRMLDGLAALWSKTPPRGPVVIAGSTGSLPAVRRLMKVVASLPLGAVVLPGLDADLDDAAWSAIEPQHPQFGLRLTLQTLGVPREAVATITGAEPSPAAAARRALVREALVPADATADWLARLERAGGAALVERALTGMSRVVCDTPEEEATVAALAMREALEIPGRTAALVTPDMALARRVSAKLRRYGLEVPISAGAPLRETPIGVLLQLLCDLALDDGAPIPLAALVQHPLAGLGLEAESRAAAIGTILDLLRGPRRPGGLEALIAQSSEPGRSALQAVRFALEPLGAALAVDPVRLDAVAGALAESAERAGVLADADGGRVWAGAAGEAAVRAVRSMAVEGGALGALTARDAARVALDLLGAMATAPAGGDHPRLAIWGPLEARMQRRDLIILGGLNEGVWPEPLGDDPFLSRAMREALGLVSPDARIGLAAHDFAQLACAPEVLLTRAQRRDGSPTVASRWLWRLETLVSGARQSDRLGPDEDWLALARRLDEPETRTRIAAPQPRPPVSARPRRLRVTEVETLIRDPYAIYARRVLGLEVKQAIGIEANAAARGTAIHAVLEAFTRDEAYRRGGAEPDLLNRLDRAFVDIGAPPETRAVERVRLGLAVDRFVAWLRQREREGYTPLIEVIGSLDLEHGFGLRGRADRIDLHRAGASIVDYKTGAPPTSKEVCAGLAPQLPLEAVLLAEGGFADAPRARTQEYVYWRFGGSDPGPILVRPDGTAEDLAKAARARFLALMQSYDDPDQPYLSKPRVKFAKAYADYDALARRKEWADADGAE